jgi:hypothetical protein
LSTVFAYMMCWVLAPILICISVYVSVKGLIRADFYRLAIGVLMLVFPVYIVIKLVEDYSRMFP